VTKLELIEMTIPCKPDSRLQKYRLTEKGKEIQEGLKQIFRNSNPKVCLSVLAPIKETIGNQEWTAKRSANEKSYWI
jgi:hypothetical protein